MYLERIDIAFMKQEQDVFLRKKGIKRDQELMNIKNMKAENFKNQQKSWKFKWKKSPPKNQTGRQIAQQQKREENWKINSGDPQSKQCKFQKEKIKR